MKNKFELEYPINSSQKVLYNRLSTPGGLSEWFADDVNQNGNIFTFVWDGSENQAEEIYRKDNKCIRFRWVDEEEAEPYFEFKIITHELTNDVALIIVDFAEDDEREEVIELWDSQIAELKRNIGL